MNRKKLLGVACMFVAMIVGISSVLAAPKKAKIEPEDPLTPAGEKLCAGYSAMLTELQAEIGKSLPKIDEVKKADYLKAREAEKAAESEVNGREAALNKNRAGVGLLSHHSAWLARATTGVAEAKEKLKQAEAMKGDTEEKAKAVKEAQEALAKIQANYEMATAGVKEAQEAVDKAKLEEPKLIKDLEAAQKALALSQADTQKAVAALNLEPFLASDKMDAQLVKCVVLSESTPHSLAAFAQQGKEQEALVDKLLADTDLMKQMVIADGAMEGKYGQAMKIYTDIQKASPKAGEGLFQRLALAVSLEHAVPILQSNPKAETNAPPTVDPVKRYLHYEKAFLDGELDPGFKDLTVWEYRMAVNGNEPDSILAWGREMLRNYRPDEIATKDYRWRYVKAVKTEVKYGSADTKNDLPTLQEYQNIINTGGVCGRRAFFGRFILRCFGIPTVARPQPGHATLAHWTPAGWVVNLGANWGAGKNIGKYDNDLDFLAVTQAREVEKAYLPVPRARWVGDVLGEKRAFGFKSVSGFWNELALLRQRQIIEEARAVALAAVGTDIGEANESKEKEVVETVTVTDEDRKVVVAPDGGITIPSVACVNTSTNADKIVFMKSVLGGMQMHYSRNGGPAPFEYTVEVPVAGAYALGAKVVTVSPDQHLLVAANDAKEPVDIALPYTIGKWDQTQPVKVTLVKGKNVLRFSRNEPVKGLTIKEFTLTPVK